MWLSWVAQPPVKMCFCWRECVKQQNPGLFDFVAMMSIAILFSYCSAVFALLCFGIHAWLLVRQLHHLWDSGLRGRSGKCKQP